MAKQSVDLQHCKSGGVRGIQKHCQREPGEQHSNKDIDDSRTHLNYDLHNAEKISFTKRVNERIKEGYTGTRKIQSNANVMECIVLQAKKEFFDNLTPEKEREFFQTAYEHICEKYGKENVVSAIVHKDEKSPHMHINFVPIRDGRLCSADLFRKQQMLDLHTDMHRALKERGFDIERGENEVEKREHLTPQVYKLKEMERVVAELEKKIPEKQQTLAVKEVELNKRIVEISRIAITDNKVKAIAETAKEKKSMFGGATGEVVLPKDEFDKLIASATIGAVAREENTNLHKKIDSITADKKGLQEKIDIAHVEKLSLIGENMQLKEKITSYDRLLNDRQIKERIDDIQNPHLAVYRELKKEVPFIAYGRDMSQHEEIAYRMMQDGRFDRGQVQEALRTDLNRDKTQDAISTASMKISQDQARQRAEQQVAQERAQIEATRQKTLAANRQKVEEHQKYLKDHPEFSKYIEQRSKGMCDTDIAFRMRHEKPAIAEYKIINAIVKGGQTKEYAEKCLKEVNKIKIPTKAQEKSMSVSAKETVNQALVTARANTLPSFSGGGGGGGGSSSSRDNRPQSAPSPSFHGPGMQANCFPIDEDELEQMQKGMERDYFGR